MSCICIDRICSMTRYRNLHIFQRHSCYMFPKTWHTHSHTLCYMFFYTIPQISNWTMLAAIRHFPVTALWTPLAFTVAHVSVESCFAPICGDPRLIGACALYTINTAWLGTVSSVICWIAFWNHCVIFIWKKKPRIFYITKLNEKCDTPPFWFNVENNTLH